MKKLKTETYKGHKIYFHRTRWGVIGSVKGFTDSGRFYYSNKDKALHSMKRLIDGTLCSW